MAQPTLAAYASRLLSQSFVTARDDEAALFVGDSHASTSLAGSSADEGRLMAYRDETEVAGDPFHSSSTPPSGSRGDDPFLDTDSSSRSPKQGWRIHQSVAPPSADSSTPSSPPHFDDVADSWVPRTNRFGMRTAKPEPIVLPEHPREVPLLDALYTYPAPSRGAPVVHSRDAPWLVAWVFSLLFVTASGLWALLQPVPAHVPDNIGASAIALLASLPLLTLFVLLALLTGASAMAYLFLVQRSVRYLVTGAMIAAPALLLVTAAWSWGGSWQGFGSVDSETEDERGTLRWFSLGCVLLAALVAKVAYDRRSRIQRTVQVIELAAEILLLHPSLLLLCLAMTAIFLVATVPVLTLTARLLLVASTSADASTPTLLALFAGFCWLWTLGVFRGVQRLAIAGTVGHWFFNRHEPTAPDPGTLVADALRRATGPSLGSACCAALLLALLDSAALSLRQLRHWTRAGRLPSLLSPLYGLAPLIAFAASAVEGLSSFALVYAGVTGDPFWTAARSASGLISRAGTGRVLDYVLVKLLLNLVSLSLSLLFGLAGYLSAATVHTQHHPGLVALVCFAVPFWTIRCCADVLGHAVDAVFVCWSLDVDAGANHCSKAAEAFGEPMGPGLPR